MAEDRSGWKTFGESVDAMPEDARGRLYEATKEKGETFEQWDESLYRRHRRARRAMRQLELLRGEGKDV